MSISRYKATLAERQQAMIDRKAASAKDVLDKREKDRRLRKKVKRAQETARKARLKLAHARTETEKAVAALNLTIAYQQREIAEKGSVITQLRYAPHPPLPRANPTTQGDTSNAQS